MPQCRTTCCNAPYGVGGERSTHWYLCTACGQPTHELDYEPPSLADLAMHSMGCDLSQVRRALEALPND